MRAAVSFRLPDGAVAELGAGDVIGRMGSASLVLDDPRISEAHAMVSLRRGDLYLLALRRLLGLGGKAVSEVLLAPGTAIDLAEGLTITVAAMATPPRVWALRARDAGVRPLAQVASIVLGPPPRLVGRFVPGAAAHLWSMGIDAWRLRIGEGSARALVLGDRFTVAGREFEVCAVDLGEAGQDTTHGGGLTSPLRIVAHYDGAEIHRANRPVVIIGGMGARLLSELVAIGGPVSWEVVARELWRDEADAGELRHRWDVALGRLRARLRREGVRGDLLRSDGAGQLQLVLNDGDHVDDRT